MDDDDGVNRMMGEDGGVFQMDERNHVAENQIDEEADEDETSGRANDGSPDERAFARAQEDLMRRKLLSVAKGSPIVKLNYEGLVQLGELARPLESVSVSDRGRDVDEHALWCVMMIVRDIGGLSSLDLDFTGPRHEHHSSLALGHLATGSIVKLEHLKLTTFGERADRWGSFADRFGRLVRSIQVSARPVPPGDVAQAVADILSLRFNSLAEFGLQSDVGSSNTESDVLVLQALREKSLTSLSLTITNSSLLPYDDRVARMVQKELACISDVSLLALDLKKLVIHCIGLGERTRGTILDHLLRSTSLETIDLQGMSFTIAGARVARSSDVNHSVKTIRLKLCQIDQRGLALLSRFENVESVHFEHVVLEPLPARVTTGLPGRLTRLVRFSDDIRLEESSERHQYNRRLNWIVSNFGAGPAVLEVGVLGANKSVKLPALKDLLVSRSGGLALRLRNGSEHVPALCEGIKEACSMTRLNLAMEGEKETVAIVLESVKQNRHLLHFEGRFKLPGAYDESEASAGSLFQRLLSGNTAQMSVALAVTISGGKAVNAVASAVRAVRHNRRLRAIDFAPCTPQDGGTPKLIVNAATSSKIIAMLEDHNTTLLSIDGLAHDSAHHGERIDFLLMRNIFLPANPRDADLFLWGDRADIGITGEREDLDLFDTKGSVAKIQARDSSPSSGFEVSLYRGRNGMLLRRSWRHLHNERLEQSILRCVGDKTRISLLTCPDRPPCVIDTEKAVWPFCRMPQLRFLRIKYAFTNVLIRKLTSAHPSQPHYRLDLHRVVHHSDTQSVANDMVTEFRRSLDQSRSPFHEATCLGVDLQCSNSESAKQLLRRAVSGSRIEELFVCLHVSSSDGSYPGVDEMDRAVGVIMGCEGLRKLRVSRHRCDFDTRNALRVSRHRCDFDTRNAREAPYGSDLLRRLLECKSLEEISFEGVSMTSSDTFAVQPAIQDLPTNLSVTHISFVDCSLTDFALLLISRFKMLESISLMGVRLPQNAQAHVTCALRSLGRLASFSFEYSEEDMDADRHLRWIASSVAPTNLIVQLGDRWDDPGDQPEFPALKDLITSCSGQLSLKLECENNTNSGFLCEGIEAAQALKELNITINDVIQDGVESILGAVSSNYELVKFVGRFGHSGWSDDFDQERVGNFLQDFIANNKRLESFGFCFYPTEYPEDKSPAVLFAARGLRRNQRLQVIEFLSFLDDYTKVPEDVSAEIVSMLQIYNTTLQRIDGLMYASHEHEEMINYLLESNRLRVSRYRDSARRAPAHRCVEILSSHVPVDLWGDFLSHVSTAECNVLVTMLARRALFGHGEEELPGRGERATKRKRDSAV
jgi:hypothetical protein